jgi:hypothetical protein
VFATSWAATPLANTHQVSTAACSPSTPNTLTPNDLFARLQGLGGGSFTAQKQRLVYWPLLKSGDVDLMKPQFDFYNRLLHNAELRTQVYWGHQGASFTEQLELLGLPVGYEYGWKRPAFYDKGMQYNKWVDYQWDTVLEFCFMMLEAHRYAGMDIKPYLPLMESALRFYDALPIPG